MYDGNQVDTFRVRRGGAQARPQQIYRGQIIVVSSQNNHSNQPVSWIYLRLVSW